MLFHRFEKMQKNNNNFLANRNFHSFFSNKKPKSLPSSKTSETAFKKYFKLTVSDQPLSPFRKAYEIWKTNPTARRIQHGGKWFFAIAFILFWKEGVAIPGQRNLRLLEIELRFKYVTRQSQEKDQDRFNRVLRYLNWKLEFANRHGMLMVKMIGHDLKYLTKLIKQSKEL